MTCINGFYKLFAPLPCLPVQRWRVSWIRSVRTWSRAPVSKISEQKERIKTSTSLNDTSSHSIMFSNPEGGGGGGGIPSEFCTCPLTRFAKMIYKKQPQNGRNRAPPKNIIINQLAVTSVLGWNYSNSTTFHDFFHNFPGLSRPVRTLCI